MDNPFGLPAGKKEITACMHSSATSFFVRAFRHQWRPPSRPQARAVRHPLQLWVLAPHPALRHLGCSLEKLRLTSPRFSSSQNTAACGRYLLSTLQTPTRPSRATVLDPSIFSQGRFDRVRTTASHTRTKEAKAQTTPKSEQDCPWSNIICQQQHVVSRHRSHRHK